MTHTFFVVHVVLFTLWNQLVTEIRMKAHIVLQVTTALVVIFPHLALFNTIATSPGNSTVWWIFMMGFIGLVTYIVYLSCWY